MINLFDLISTSPRIKSNRVLKLEKQGRIKDLIEAIENQKLSGNKYGYSKDKTIKVIML